MSSCGSGRESPPVDPSTERQLDLAPPRQRHLPAASIALWAEDEHRLGVLPVVCRVWAPRGQRPIAWGNRHYQWLYVFGFVRPATGQTWWCLLPTVTTDW